MDPITMAVIMGGMQLAGSLFNKPKQAKYTPNPKWLAMREDVMAGIREGLEQGGFTWSEEMGDKMYLQAVDQISARFGDAERRAFERLAPYGNVGAASRAAVGIGVERAKAEAGARTTLDIARETEQLRSKSQLLQIGGSIQDPNLPQAQLAGLNAQLQGPSPGQALESALVTGLNTYEAQTSKDFWQDWLKSKATPPAAPTVSTPQGSPSWLIPSGSRMT